MSCPHCGAVLPEPPDRFCPACGTDLEARGPVPGEPPPPPLLTTPQRRPGSTPWEERGRIGIVQALIETTQKVLSGPSAFFSSMPVTGGIGGPLLYAMVVGSLGVIVAAIYREVFRALMGSTLTTLGGGSEVRRLMPFLMGGMGLVLQVVFAPLIVILGVFIVSAIVHGVLMLLGGAKRGFEATLRVACYGEAAALLNIVPICGNLISGVWYVVLVILGLAAAHGIGKGTAAAAVLLPLVLVCCCCAGGVLLAMGGVASILSQMK
jgi:hypothetical protein